MLGATSLWQGSLQHLLMGATCQGWNRDTLMAEEKFQDIQDISRHSAHYAKYVEICRRLTNIELALWFSPLFGLFVTQKEVTTTSQHVPGQWTSMTKKQEPNNTKKPCTSLRRFLFFFFQKRLCSHSPTAFLSSHLGITLCSSSQIFCVFSLHCELCPPDSPQSAVCSYRYTTIYTNFLSVAPGVGYHEGRWGSTFMSLNVSGV